MQCGLTNPGRADVGQGEARHPFRTQPRETGERAPQMMGLRVCVGHRQTERFGAARLTAHRQRLCGPQQDIRIPRFALQRRGLLGIQVVFRNTAESG